MDLFMFSQVCLSRMQNTEYFNIRCRIQSDGPPCTMAACFPFPLLWQLSAAFAAKFDGAAPLRTILEVRKVVPVDTDAFDL